MINPFTLKLLEKILTIADLIFFILALAAAVFFLYKGEIHLATFSMVFAVFLKHKPGKHYYIDTINDYGNGGSCSCKKVNDDNVIVGDYPDTTGMVVEGDVDVQIPGQHKDETGEIKRDTTKEDAIEAHREYIKQTKAKQ